jgi:hypothetical protein
MAHFAELDQNSKVVRILTVDNNDLLAGDGQEHEEIGVAFLQGIFGSDTRWVQTSYNSNFRGKYAAIGDVYDEILDVFSSPVATRARDEQGRFVGDDPSTPENEAWVGGIAPGG